MKKENLLRSMEKAYEKARAEECEELHNAIGVVITEQKASIQNTLFVLEIIRFELLEGKYKEIMGVVQLSDKLPIAVIGKGEKKD